MKKLFVFFCLLPMLAGVALAQDEGARQDINLSFMGDIQPYVSSNSAPVVRQDSTLGAGLYLGYRYLLTPSSGLEANYSYSHFTQKFSYAGENGRVYTGFQEATGAYVHTFNFRRWNPFLEAGGGMVFFTPNRAKSNVYDTQQGHGLTVLFGGGIAYELSPSWDLRVQYRAQLLSSYNFGLSSSPYNFTVGRRYIMSQPAVGLAYHF